MAAETKKQAWFMSAVAVVAALLGALVEQNVIPPPWNGVVVTLCMLFAQLKDRPGAPRLPDASEAHLLDELERRDMRARNSSAGGMP